MTSLLKAAPCAACTQRIAATPASSIICNGCNGIYHLACVGLKVASATYWYCGTCTKQLHATGIGEPAEDLAFQHYLLEGKLQDDTLRPYFTAFAAHYRYKECLHEGQGTRYMQLQRLKGMRWLNYASPAERTLILEE